MRYPGPQHEYRVGRTQGILWVLCSPGTVDIWEWKLSYCGDLSCAPQAEWHPWPLSMGAAAHLPPAVTTKNSQALLSCLLGTKTTPGQQPLTYRIL